MRRREARLELAKDLALIGFGAVIAIVLVQLGFIDKVIDALGGGVAASFVSGVFFTSVFTIAPAAVSIAHISDLVPTGQLVLWGSLGAMCGDLILFLYIRDRFARDLINVLGRPTVKRIASTFHFGFMKWLSPILGALIIASPLPDEFGLALMGLSRTKIVILLPISFVMNALGIYAIVWFAQLF